MDENLLYENQTQPPKKGSSLLLVLLLGLLLTVAGSVYFFFFQRSLTSPLTDTSSLPIVTDAEKKAVGDRLLGLYDSETGPVVTGDNDPLNYGLESTKVTPIKGLFVLSGKQKPFLSDVQEFTIDLGSTTSEPVLLMPEFHTSAMAEFNDQRSPSNLFFLAPANLGQSSEGSEMSIYNYNIATKELSPIENAKGESNRNFAWSASAHLLAYNRLSSSAKNIVDLLPVTNWEIAIVDTESGEVKDVISGGRSPHWSPDGSELIYLKDDGMYLYKLESKEEKRVVAVGDGGKVIGTSMFDVSPDGSHLVWTTAKIGLITVSQIGSWSWDAFKITELGRIHVPDTEYYWPQFSPDGLHYAVQAIDSEKEDSDQGRTNGRIEIRQTEGRLIQYTYSLKKFAFNLLFTDDWIDLSPKE